MFLLFSLAVALGGDRVACTKSMMTLELVTAEEAAATEARAAAAEMREPRPLWAPRGYVIASWVRPDIDGANDRWFVVVFSHGEQVIGRIEGEPDVAHQNSGLMSEGFPWRGHMLAALPEGDMPMDIHLVDTARARATDGWQRASRCDAVISTSGIKKL